MEYVPPVGAEADEPYINGNPSLGIEGSPVPAAAIEHPMREILAVIERAGLTPSAENLEQLADAIVTMIAAALPPADPNLLRRNVHARLEAAYTSAVRTANASGNITVDLNTQEGLQVLTLTGAATLDALVADGGGTAVIWVVPGGHALSINTANFRVIDDSKPLSLTREMILQLQYRGTGRCDLAIQYAGV